jgi:geranylgeranyl pyrophosphate synthase
MSVFTEGMIHRALHQPVDDFSYRQGKRIRGSMMQICFEMASGRGRVPDVIIEAIESLHGGSLIIDDVQDDSKYRRGEPTMHREIGVPLAINAGNWLYFRALELLATAPIASDQRHRLTEAMIIAGRRCHEGQSLDLVARIDQVPASHWHDTVEAISTLKTGVLVELAVAMGCVAANEFGILHSAMTYFGCQIGVALQMRNDLEELSNLAHAPSDSAESGDVRDDDLRHARVTWPWVWALHIAGADRCFLLTQQLRLSKGDRQAVALELLSISQAHGNQVISSMIREQIRLLGEYVVDQRLLQRMRECLRKIEQSGEQQFAEPNGQSRLSDTKASEAMKPSVTTAGAE